MVDALRSAGRVLRPRGRIVDLRPAVTYRPTIVIRRGRKPIAVGPIFRDHDADVAAAARAVRSLVRRRELMVVRSSRPKFVASYADLADVERALSFSETWHLPPATRRRIAREWRAGDAIEITRPFSVTVLRLGSASR